MGRLEEIKPEDMTEEEIGQLTLYVKNGLPGIQRVQESDIFQWFELYMAGKTYDEIARATGAQKDKVLYISHKQEWHDKRMQHYNDLLNNITGKLTHTKLGSINTMATIIAALNKFYGNKFNKYLKNNDESIIENLDTKLLTQYYKSMDTIEKLASDGRSKNPNSPDNGGNPLIHMNIGNATIQQNEGEPLEITEENAGDILKSLAGSKKKQNDEKE